MPGLVPGIHVLATPRQESRGGRDEPGHDEKENLFHVVGKNLKTLDAFRSMLRGAKRRENPAPSFRGDAKASSPESRDSGSGAGAPSRNDGWCPRAIDVPSPAPV